MIAKTVIVVDGMTGRESRVSVPEGARPADVLAPLQMEGSQLSRVRNREALPADCDVASAVQHGERLFASPHIEVGEME